MLKKSVLGLFAIVMIANVATAAVYFVRSLDRDLSIPEAAIEFQEAYFGNNYEAMWDLSAEPYRGGRSRDEFLEWARQNNPPPDRLVDWTVLDEHTEDRARAHTRIQLERGGIVMHELMMVKIEEQWKVTHHAEYTGEWPPDEAPLNPQSS